MLDTGRCAFLFALGWLGSSCRPDPRAEVPAGGATAVVSACREGVKLEVGAAPWRGEAKVLEHARPVAVTLSNRSAGPLLLRYADLELHGPGGARHPVPPFPDATRAPEPASAAPIDPRWRHRDFYVLPAAGRARYRGVPVYEGPLAPTDGAGPGPTASFEHWREHELPLEPLRAHALPEGVLLPGGEVSGLLFFPGAAAPGEAGARLRFAPRSSRSSDPIEVALP